MVKSSTSIKRAARSRRAPKPPAWLDLSVIVDDAIQHRLSQIEGLARQVEWYVGATIDMLEAKFADAPPEVQALIRQHSPIGPLAEMLTAATGSLRVAQS